ncbi:MAG: class I SAM-dependent methyltransferase [Proteobacteria bacterium]|nr:class I SAM-dependent methyltransferase [Pseudomonadota bacterium]
MLFGLERLQSRIVGAAIPEAEIYRDERLYKRPRQARIARGQLQCPICGASARRFLAFGLAGRRNAQCPGCGSLERHRMLWLYLARHTDLGVRRYRVLHTAPEPCLADALARLPNLRTRSVDRFNPHADVQADLTDLPFADRRFDVVLSSHVLEHIPDDGAAIAELARVLRPGGWAAIMVPYDPARPATEEGRHIASPAERLARFGHPYHYRIYGADFPARLADAGFHVTAVSSRRLLTAHRRRRYRINRNYLFVCTRPPERAGERAGEWAGR